MLESSQLTQPQQLAIAGIPIVLTIFAVLDLARLRLERQLRQVTNKRLWSGSQVLAAYLTARGQELTRPLSSIVDSSELYSHFLATNIASLQKLVLLEQQLAKTLANLGRVAVYIAVTVTYIAIGYSIFSGESTYLVWGIASFYLSLVIIIVVSLLQVFILEPIRKVLIDLHLVAENEQTTLEFYILLTAVSTGRIYYLIFYQLLAFLNPLPFWKKGNETNT